MKRGPILFGILIILVIAMFVAARAEAHRYMASMRCGNSMLTLVEVAREWTAAHEGRLPTSFQSLSNEVQRTAILLCPADKERKQAVDWASVGDATCSYEIVGSGVVSTNKPIPFMKCKIHGFIGYSDGTAFEGNRQITRW